MVEELVREFVPDAVAAGLDFSRLQRVNPKFLVGRRSARRREGDVIWRLPTSHGSDVYLYLLIEFQSDSDWWMAVRTQVYQGSCGNRSSMRRSSRAARGCPHSYCWCSTTAHSAGPPQSSSLSWSDWAHSTLWQWQPQIRYHLLDMGAFAGAELARRDSLVALLFRLEQQCPPQQLEELIEEVIGWFRQHEGFAELKRLVHELIEQAIHSVAPRVQIPDDLLEMKSMLATIGEVWKQQWLAEGKAEGEIKGRAGALVRLLVKRFGALAPPLRERIHKADLATIEIWFDRAIDAPDLPSVFERLESAESLTSLL
jgi:hypothetical protein